MGLILMRAFGGWYIDTYIRDLMSTLDSVFNTCFNGSWSHCSARRLSVVVTFPSRLQLLF